MEIRRSEGVKIKQEISFPETETFISDPSIKLEDYMNIKTEQNTHLNHHDNSAIKNCGEAIYMQSSKELVSASLKTYSNFGKKESENKKLYCRKCGGSFDFKCDLFNHMFLHIDIIMAEAEYIRSTRKAGSEAISKEDEDKHLTENDCKNDNVKEHLEQNQSTECVLTKGALKFESNGDLDEAMGGFESDDFIQVDHSTSQRDVVSTDSNKKIHKKKKLPKSKSQLKENNTLGAMLKVKARVKQKKTKKAKEKNEVDTRRRMEEPPIYECNDCNYKSLKLWAMRKHCIVHLPNNPFKCSKCDFSCRTRFSLESHLTTHTGEMPHKCEHCGKSFRTRVVWSRHVETHNEKNHTCHICAKKFHRSDSLRYHVLSHSEQRPHKCHICPYSAKHLKALKMHIQFHGELKRFDCPSCDFKTSKRSNLTKHIRVHSSEAKYKCDKCTFSCRSDSTFKKHYDVHKTTAHVFSCSECDFKSTMERAVMRHLRQHQNIPLKLLQIKVKTLNRDLLPRA